jgi:hypothetical protein
MPVPRCDALLFIISPPDPSPHLSSGALGLPPHAPSHACVLFARSGEARGGFVRLIALCAAPRVLLWLASRPLTALRGLFPNRPDSLPPLISLLSTGPLRMDLLVVPLLLAVPVLLSVRRLLCAPTPHVRVSAPGHRANPYPLARRPLRTTSTLAPLWLLGFYRARHLCV